MKEVHRFSRVIVVQIICLISSPAWSAPIHLEIFSDQAITYTPRPGISVEVFNLGELTQLRKDPPRFNGATLGEAERNAMKWKETPEFDKYKSRLRQAYRPLNRMSHYRIMKIPAVVIEGRYVIYGNLDLDQVLDDYKIHISTERTSTRATQYVTSSKNRGE